LKFVSTRGQSPAVSLSEAILQGLAPDKGLYVPEKLPHADGPLKGPSLRDTAQWMLEPFFEGDALAPELPAMLKEAFTFGAPLVTTLDPALSILELFHGPTAAFKDFGARFLAACFRRLAPFALSERSESKGQTITILVATSGDTGSAVGAAFHQQPNTRVAILYPEGRVSARQAHQLGSFGGNVHALVVKGTFDDCQALVKRALADQALRAKCPLASANSVSLGRLLPQMAYYAHAVRQFSAAQDPGTVHPERAKRVEGPALNICIPTGNLGNAFACLLARAAGAPIGDVLLATNANRAIVDFFGGETYAPLPTIATLANAMDVGAPSNFERLTWLHPRPEQHRVFADSVDDETIKARIGLGERKYGHVFDPHTACAVEAIERRRHQGDQRPWCAVATAHPAQVERVVEPLIGHAVPPPPALAEMLARPSKAEPLANNDGALREWLLRP
jgi:threonine synthase